MTVPPRGMMTFQDAEQCRHRLTGFQNGVAAAVITQRQRTQQQLSLLRIEPVKRRFGKTEILHHGRCAILCA